jgi:hypothetical protein
MTMLNSSSRRGGRRGTLLPDTSDPWVSAEDWSSLEAGSTVEVDGVRLLPGLGGAA